MNLRLHVLRKDLRAVRPWLVVFGGTLLLQVLLSVRLPLNGEVRLGLEILLAAAQGVIALLALLAAVHADSFQGSTAFWKTRPLPPGTVLGAKAILAVAFLVIPFFLAEGLIWWLAGFDSVQMLRALGGWLLVLVPWLLAVFVLALSTRSVGQFAAAIGGLLLGAVLLVLGYESLRRQGWLPQAELHSGPGRMVSALLVGGFLLSACALTAMVASAFRRAGAWGIGILAAGVLTYTGTLLLWPDSFFQTPTAPPSHLRVRLLQAGEEPPSATDAQMLWSHFRVDGLAPNQVAAVEGFNATFKADRGETLEFRYGLPWKEPSEEATLAHSPQEADYFARIRSWFPARTLWFGNWSTRSVRSLPLATSGPVTLREREVGRFSGELQVREFTIEELGVLPLSVGPHLLGGGLQVDIRHVGRSAAGLYVELREARPDLLLDLARRGRRPGFKQSGLVYVLYNPKTGEAFVQEPDLYGIQRSDLYAGRRHTRVDLRFAYPEVRVRLAGLSPQDWFQTARLHVFQARPGGLVAYPFNPKDYVLRLGDDSRSEATRLEGLARIEAAQLPPQPDVADYEAYVDGILLALPDTRDHRELDVVRAKLTAIGAEGLEAFIRRLPVDERLEYRVTGPLLSDLAERRHLPALEAALRRDPGLAWLFRAKAWEVEARVVLRQLLREARAPLPAEALRIAAEQAPPEFYPAIQRDFELLERGHETVYAALKDLPGFELEAAVRTAWKRARLGLASQVEVALLAAPLDLPGALDAAIEAVEQHQRDAEGSAWARELRRLTGYQEAFGPFGEWLSAHRGSFRFQPATGTYEPGRRN